MQQQRSKKKIIIFRRFDFLTHTHPNTHREIESEIQRKKGFLMRCSQFKRFIFNPIDIFKLSFGAIYIELIRNKTNIPSAYNMNHTL